jgi:hypothetical protein
VAVACAVRAVLGAFAPKPRSEGPAPFMTSRAPFVDVGSDAPLFGGVAVTDRCQTEDYARLVDPGDARPLAGSGSSPRPT